MCMFIIPTSLSFADFEISSDNFVARIPYTLTNIKSVMADRGLPVSVFTTDGDAWQFQSWEFNAANVDKFHIPRTVDLIDSSDFSNQWVKNFAAAKGNSVIYSESVPEKNGIIVITKVPNKMYGHYYFVESYNFYLNKISGVVYKYIYHSWYVSHKDLPKEQLIRIARDLNGCMKPY